MNLSDAFIAAWNAHANPIDAAQAVRLLHRAHHLLKNIGMAKNHATRLMESERDGSTTVGHIKAAITAASIVEKPGEVKPEPIAANTEGL